MLFHRCCGAVASVGPSSAISGVAASAAVASSASHLRHQRRSFETLKHTNDVAAPTMMEILGLRGENELAQLQKSPQMLRAAFRRRAKMLRPDTVPADAERMKVLVNAYNFLKSDANKLNYLQHYKSSIDQRLGIVREGDDVFGNFDPEHQSLDHLLMRGEAESGFEAAEALGTQRTFSDFTRVYKDTTGAEARGASDADIPTAAPPKPGEKLRPAKGADIAFLLKLSFEEGAHGCQREISYERQKRCVMCRGSGRAGVVHTKCPQCHGRGSTKMRSGTYDVKEQCDYCMGHGKVPPRLCGCCKGHCTLPSTDTYVVNVPSASANMTELWVQRKGHDGKRGGAAGNLIVTLMVSEHRVFHTSGLDLHAALPITLSTALLGGYVDVPSLAGKQRLLIRPMTTSGDIYTLAGKGITDHLAAAQQKAAAAAGDSGATTTAARSCGDLKFHTVVVIPSGERLTSRQMSAMGVLKQAEDRAEEEERLRADAEAKLREAAAEAAAAAVARAMSENATRRPRTFEGEVTSEEQPTAAAAAATPLPTEKPKSADGGGSKPLPTLRRPTIPRQPVAADADGADGGAAAKPRIRNSVFFTPKDGPAASVDGADRVFTPTMDELSALKAKYSSWLPRTKPLGDL